MRLGLSLLALLLAGAAGPAGGLAAQAAGLPVRNAGIGTGVGLAGDVGFPSAAGGKGIAIGATGMIGLGPLGASATLAHWTPKDQDGINSVAATANLKIIGGPLIPLSVTLQAGAGYGKSTQQGFEAPVTTKTVHVPVGLGIALTIPNPVFSIKPWVAPRLDLQRVTIESDTPAETHTDTHFGISGGVDFGFLNGMTIRAMYDRLQAGNGAHPSILSVGLGFRVGT
ncbi:MAG TPA: outer membrane beta-barrel protein [Gemmatimonadales bacterium]|nr:outer membrane beta-barrel protein [Gemmatimonadales bacterium]